MDHIWTIENWEQNIDFMEEGHRTGFRLRFDSGIDPEVRRACKEFAAFLRKEYFFPLRVVAYIKNKKKIRAMDGDLVYGTFWSMEDDYTVEPYIRVAAGDYLDLCDKWGKDSALTATDTLFSVDQRIGINPDRDGASGNKICKICVRRLCRNKGASLSEDRMKKGKEK